MSDVGKAAKHMGLKHPSELRRIDPVPERPTPKAKPKRKVDKPWGYSYDYEPRWWFGRNKTLFAWFKTKVSRDQAMAAMIRKDYSFYKNIAAVDPDDSVAGKDCE